jgi:hypothetical protein
MIVNVFVISLLTIGAMQHPYHVLLRHIPHGDGSQGILLGSCVPTERKTNQRYLHTRVHPCMSQRVGLKALHHQALILVLRCWTMGSYGKAPTRIFSH